MSRKGLNETPDGASRANPLGQLRLLVAFDALLREGSVAKAAQSMGLQSSALSRMLAQLREKYGDALFTRSSKGLLPTPFAEKLRLRLRALAAEAEQLVDISAAARPATDLEAIASWESKPLIAAPPLAVRPNTLLQGQPTPEGFARKLAGIGHNAPPQKRLAKYIALTGMGAGRSRPLELEEAEDALSIILAGEADPIQIGALLTTMHYRGATATELAGFTRASRSHIGADDVGKGNADLDWPVYLSPKVKSPPWFLHAARLVAGAGYRVLLHGHYGQGDDAGKLELAARLSDIPVVSSVSSARDVLRTSPIAFLPVGAASPQIQGLLSLYAIMEMRLPLNAVVHLLNPLGARASILGVAQPSTRSLHRDIARILNMRNLAIFGATRDYAEFTPFRLTRIFRLVNGVPDDLDLPPIRDCERQAMTGYTSRQYWEAVWKGGARDPAAEAIIIGTAAVALMTVNPTENMEFERSKSFAAKLWQERKRGS